MNKRNLKKFGFFFIFLLFLLFLFFNSKEATAAFKISRPSTHNLGLVGHWTFDGGKVVNGVALDSTANGNNGNLVNIATSTFYATGKIGQGFNFDGTDDYISIPYNSSLELGNTGSVSLWVKPTVTSPSQTRNLVSYGGTSYASGYLLSQHDTSLWVYWMNGAKAFSVSNAFTANTWSHIVLTNDNGALTAYVNGVQGGSGTSGGTIINDYSTLIGGTSTGWIENGNIDDVRVYNRALSASEAKSLYNQGTNKLNKTSTNTLMNGLVSHWTFDGADTDWTTNTTLDRSGNNNTGTMTGMSTSTSPTVGKIGQGFEFDNVNDYVGTTRINNNEMSVSAWWYKNANNFENNRDAIVANYYWTSDLQLRQGFMLAFSLLGSTCGAGGSAGYLCLELITLTTNGSTVTVKNSYAPMGNISKNGTSTLEWFHTVATYNSTDGYQRLYVNGVLRDSDLHVAGNTIVPYTDVSGGGCHNLNKLFIGRACVNPGYWNGKIDDVRIYNRALSAAEVKLLYNMGR